MGIRFRLCVKKGIFIRMRFIRGFGVFFIRKLESMNEYEEFLILMIKFLITKL